MWVDEPGDVGDVDFVPLIRPKPGKSAVVFLIDRPLRLFLHYWNKRTWPCTGRKCPLCAKQVGKRLYSYYPTQTFRGNPSVLELTPVSENALTRQMLEHSDEPQGVVKVTRPTGRKNLPCEIQWRPIAKDDPPLVRPKDPEFLIKTLCRMWKLPCPQGDSTSFEWVDALNEALVSTIAQLETNT